MSRALERLVNLAMYLASARASITAEDVRANVDGYGKHQDQSAFLRMFERDKEDLRVAGFVIESDSEGSYRLDTSATFAREVSLSPEEAATVRVVASAFVDDKSFPFADDLRLALAKVATDVADEQTPVFSRLAEEQPAQQGASVALLDRAMSARKRVELDYVNIAGDHKHHLLEPYGLFIRDGRWYAVGRDVDLDEVRIYTVSRMSSLRMNPARPKTADFERPTDFDVQSFIALPFQYGPETFEAHIEFAPSQTWRTPALTAGVGSIAIKSDGSATWTVSARDPERLMRWVVENGPGINLREPRALADDLRERLTRVAAIHE